MRCFKRILGLVTLMVSVATGGQIQSLPSAGKSLGMIRADQTGKWLVMTVDRSTFYFAFPELILLDDGRVCVWEGAAGVYGVVFDASDGTRQTTNVALGEKDSNPPRPPPPAPIPDGLWNLTKTAYQRSVDLALPALLGQQVKKVAANYKFVADEIAAARTTTVDQAKSLLKAANRQEVPEADRPKWIQWDAAVTAILAAHDADLKSDIKMVAEAFKAIGAGLTLSTGR